jgi:hypothetical protein
MAKDGQDLEWTHPDRDETPRQDYWASHFLRRLPTPKWQTRHENLPTLANPTELDREWRIRFASGSAREMEAFAFEASPKAAVRYIGVTVRKGVRPTAWLIYFRHTAQAKDFSGNLLEMGDRRLSCRTDASRKTNSAVGKECWGHNPSRNWFIRRVCRQSALRHTMPA